MDVFERLNRTFGAWYEGLFGGGSDESDLRPRDILRRILRAMEDGRREGLDGQIYVPNQFILDIAVADEDERDYLRTFLDADELAAIVRRHIEQHGYRTRGGLRFEINEVSPSAAGGDAIKRGRVDVRCRFDASIPERPAPSVVEDPEKPVRPLLPNRRAAVYTPPPANDAADSHAGEDHDGDMGTVPAGAGATGSLTIRYGDGRPAEAVPLTAQGVQIGRSRQAANQVVIEGDGMVSKRHARIEVGVGGRWVVRDLGSTNGTYVNEEPLVPGEERPLAPGDEIRVGATRLAFAPAASPILGAGTIPAPQHAAAAAHAGNGGALLSVARRLVAENGNRFPLASEMIVGRTITSDLLLLDEGVAPQHARLTVRGDHVYVEDQNTQGGTWVNGERIPSGFPVVLYAGDSVRFGQGSLLRLEQIAAGGAAAAAVPGAISGGAAAY